MTPAHLVPGQGRGRVGEADVFGEEARQTGTPIIIWGVWLRNGNKQEHVEL